MEGAMSKFQIFILAGFLVALVGAAWMFRYDAKHSGLGSLVTDRWTGTVYRCRVLVGDALGCEKEF
jgi:hypothetical protein